MTKFHVAVVAARPLKGADNKYLPIPTENVDFVNSVLSLVEPGNYLSLNHGATDNTIDEVVDDYAYRNNIRVKQFPAYWFNPTKPNNMDKAAGLFRNEQMVRSLSNAIHNTEDQAIVLMFHTTENPFDDGALKALNDFIAKRNAAGKYGNITVRTFRLPVTTAPSVNTETVALNTAPATMPDPFQM